MKAIIILMGVWAAVFIGALQVLPNPVRYIAGPHAGEVYAGGAGIYMLAFYLATITTLFVTIAVIAIFEPRQ